MIGGLYRYVRNPMYLAVLAAIVGQAIALWQTCAAVVRGRRVRRLCELREALRRAYAGAPLWGAVRGVSADGSAVATAVASVTKNPAQPFYDRARV